MSIQSNNKCEQSKLLDEVRTLGRILIDRTGNGPPTKRERLLQATRLQQPHPKYSAFGPYFLSERSSGESLTAQIVTLDDTTIPIHSGRMVQIDLQPATIPAPSEGRPGPKFLIDPDLFELTSEADFSSANPDKIAQRIAQIGRLLVYAPPSKHAVRDELTSNIPSILLNHDDSNEQFLKLLLNAILIANGQDQDNRVLVYLARSPTQHALIRPVGFSGTIRHNLRKLLGSIQNNQMIVYRYPDAIIATPNVIFVSAAQLAIVDKMKIMRIVTSTLEAAGLSADDLILESQAIAA
jgi:hypothetical protein